MKSGAPAFGTPEYMKAQIVGGQLARRYSIPYRTSNVCAANTVDAQAAYESVFSLWGAIQGGGNFILHARRLAGRRAALLLREDDPRHRPPADGGGVPDAARAARRTRSAVEAMRDVGPGGHFFGTPHTQSRYRDAFYAPIMSDWRNYESWAEAGSPTALERANRVWKERLANYEQPPMDPAIARGTRRLRRQAAER